ncbi:MAG: YraN family protein [Gammaproteobacteria bacterium]
MLNKPKAPHIVRGATAEEQAHNYLLSQGLTPVCRNFHSKQGELDLIMKDGDALVIIEVRYRKNNYYGGALESITPKKQSRIIAATHHYLMQNKVACPIRFDVVAISGDASIKWIKNAFQT